MSTALTINIAAANATLPTSIAERLNSTPTKPVAADLEKSSERSSKLRAAHLEAVRDRAARETQRQKEAVARKLRLGAHRINKLQQKMENSSARIAYKKEADDAENMARKNRREALALAVATARESAGEVRTMRQAELLAAEKHASANHAKNMSTVVAKNKMAVQHALAVAQAHKDKVVADAATRGAALADRLHAAEARRQLLSPAADSGAHSPPAPLHRVLNDGKFLSETRRVALEASLAKAEAQRSAHLAGVQRKAARENAKAAAVAAQAKAAATGTDAATAGARAALYERLLGAEVSRLSALKAKYASKRGAAAAPILVRLDDVITPRAPPAKLVERLCKRPKSLLATAESRQQGAAARRRMAQAARALTTAKAASRRAAATAAVRRAADARATAVTARADAATVRLALTHGARMAKVDAAKKRAASARALREQLAAGLAKAGKSKRARAAAAAERKATGLRAVAKRGVVAVRRAAFESRRTALADRRRARGAALALRCAAVAETRAALVAKIVAKAKAHTGSSVA